MKRLTLILIALVTYSLLASNHCRKDPTSNAKLPPATQEGRNTVGFMIDDEVWVPYYECRFMGDPCGEISARYGEFGGAAPDAIDFQFIRQRDGKLSALTISSSGSGTVTTTGNKIDSISIEFQDETLVGYIPIFTGPLSGSKFIITKFDPQNQIISGEFTFDLIEQNGSGKIITLKDGRFDFSFNACKCSN
jgi:hypothetical protein